MWAYGFNSRNWHAGSRTRDYSSKKMISMTAQEFAEVVQSVEHDRREYAPDTDRNHDRYGNDTRDHHSFDARHTEDVFPY